MNLRMAAIMGIFPILWVYLWFVDCLAAGDCVELGGGPDNLLSVAAYRHFARTEKARRESPGRLTPVWLEILQRK
jgi:hypothetical protein